MLNFYHVFFIILAAGLGSVTNTYSVFSLYLKQVWGMWQISVVSFHRIRSSFWVCDEFYFLPCLFIMLDAGLGSCMNFCNVFSSYSEQTWDEWWILVMSFHYTHSRPTALGSTVNFCHIFSSYWKQVQGVRWISVILVHHIQSKSRECDEFLSYFFIILEASLGSVMNFCHFTGSRCRKCDEFLLSFSSYLKQVLEWWISVMYFHHAWCRSGKCEWSRCEKCEFLPCLFIMLKAGVGSVMNFHHVFSSCWEQVWEVWWIFIMSFRLTQSRCGKCDEFLSCLFVLLKAGVGSVMNFHHVFSSCWKQVWEVWWISVMSFHLTQSRFGKCDEFPSGLFVFLKAGVGSVMNFHNVFSSCWKQVWEVWWIFVMSFRLTQSRFGKCDEFLSGLFILLKAGLGSVMNFRQVFSSYSKQVWEVWWISVMSFRLTQSRFG